MLYKFIPSIGGKKEELKATTLGLLAFKKSKWELNQRFPKHVCRITPMHWLLFGRSLIDNINKNVYM